jgi:TolB-like protein/DNA-binding winged helix-turn-helix (wHTH) protein/Tfp pilus assembly protein PilF
VSARVPPSRGIYQFVGYRLDVQERLLLRDGCAVSITPKIFDALLLFVENPSRLLAKDEIMRSVWPDTHIDEATLTRMISELRKTLGERAGEANFVQTVPKRGYRFVAPVEVVPELVPVEPLVPLPVVTAQPRQLDASQHLQSHKTNSWRGAPTGILSLLVIAVALLAATWIYQLESRETSVPPKSIAVLPFRQLGNTSDQFWVLGLTETLIARLSGVPELTVRPASAVSGQTDPKRDPVAIGRILKVDTVLEGSVQIMLDEIRVTLRLIRVQDAKPLWAATLDGNLRDIFSLQDSVSREVATALKLQLSSNEKKIFAKRSTNDREAYEAYVRGRFFLSKRSPEGFKKASDYFQQGIRRDASYALAYVGLADTYLTLQGSGLENPQEATPQARKAAQLALKLDPSLGAAHNSLAAVAEDYDSDWQTAEKEFKLALELDPGFAPAHEWYGEFLGLMGRFDQGLAEEERALDIDPLSPTINEIKGKILLWARRYDEAVLQFQRTLELDPSFSPGRIWLARTYVAKAMPAEALAEAQKDNSFQHSPVSVETLAMTYADAGQKDVALKLLEELRARDHQEYIPPFNLAYVYLFFGQKDRAIDQLNVAVEKHDPNVPSLKVDPLLDPLRSEPRFRELLKRLNLAMAI